MEHRAQRELPGPMWLPGLHLDLISRQDCPCDTCFPLGPGHFHNKRLAINASKCSFYVKAVDYVLHTFCNVVRKF